MHRPCAEGSSPPGWPFEAGKGTSRATPCPASPRALSSKFFVTAPSAEDRALACRLGLAGKVRVRTGEGAAARAGPITSRASRGPPQHGRLLSLGSLPSGPWPHLRFASHHGLMLMFIVADVEVLQLLQYALNVRHGESRPGWLACSVLDRKSRGGRPPNVLLRNGNPRNAQWMLLWRAWGTRAACSTPCMAAGRARACGDRPGRPQSLPTITPTATKPRTESCLPPLLLLGLQFPRYFFVHTMHNQRHYREECLQRSTPGGWGKEGAR